MAADENEEVASEKRKEVKKWRFGFQK